jgi:serine/threonine protein kinase
MNYETVKEVFEKALGLPQKEREKFLIEHVQGEVLQEVRSLLACSQPSDATDFSYEPMIGKTVGSFLITKRIGSGGMGRVYEAQDGQTGKHVALKILRKQLLGSNASKRFEQEVRVLGAIEHSGVAKIESAGTVEVDGVKLPWIAMELLEGSVSITDFAEGKSIDEKLRLLREVCVAVDEAHRHGVIHRDLKPNNILVDPNGHPKIIDFGIAKVLDEQLQATGLHTQASGLLGTPQYMAPEQFAQGNAETTATDVFSLGVVMFEVLTGEHPFAGAGKSIPEIMLSITSGEPVSIETFNPSLRGDISVVVHKALAKEPRKRYANANELVTELQHITDGEPVTAKPEHMLSKFVRKHRFAAAFLVITIPLLAIATTVSVYYAINANHQLVRNEKLLEFAEVALVIDRSITQQHPNYWGEQIANAKLTAITLTPNNPILRIEMYEMLGRQDVDASVGQSMASAYSEAFEMSKKLNGVDDPRTLLLEAKLVHGFRGREFPFRLERMDSILKRWNTGSSRELAELLLLASYVKLNSESVEILEQGKMHAKEVETIARNELANDIELIVKAHSIRSWSLVFKDGSKDAVEEAIHLVEESIAQLQKQVGLDNQEKIQSLKNTLAIAKYMRGDQSDIDDAIQINNEIINSLIKKTGHGHNKVWQSMNNLAMCYVAKARMLENKTPGEAGQVIELKQKAAMLWSRVLQQSQFKKNDDYDVHEWYLSVYQDFLPEYAPTNEQWREWVSVIEEPLVNH